uniref:Gfo/Idh/MocA family oxidoreductase n=1 Tax=Planktothricoides sp. SpSt-374 TaxID=2282167 RepID=A0A7C3ZTH6_9CYAN
MRIAIIGAGRWGVNLVRNFWEHPAAELVAVVDRNPERLAEVRTRFNLPFGVLLTTQWEEVAANSSLDAVAIATPAATHYPLIAQALKQRLHVLAEKPLTLDPEESLELCHQAEAQGCLLMVDHTYLFHPAVERGTEIVQGGRLGELRYGYATRTHLSPVRPDADALWDLAIHDICIFNQWLGETPVSLQAKGTIWLQDRGENLPLFQNGLSDLVWVHLTYKSGFQAMIHLCWCNPDKQRRLAVVGTRGTLIFDELSAEAPLTLQMGHLESSEGKFAPAGVQREVVEISRAEPLGQVCDRFIHQIISGLSDNNQFTSNQSHISSGWMGAELVKMLTVLSHSMRLGGQELPLSK